MQNNDVLCGECAGILKDTDETLISGPLGIFRQLVAWQEVCADCSPQLAHVLTPTYPNALAD